jgi:hypothetical protein
MIKQDVIKIIDFVIDNAFMKYSDMTKVLEFRVKLESEPIGSEEKKISEKPSIPSKETKAPEKKEEIKSEIPDDDLPFILLIPLLFSFILQYLG